MSTLKIVALLLIVASVVGLMYGGITYSKTTHEAKVGPFELSVKDKETVNIPVWAGVCAIVVGGILLWVRLFWDERSGMGRRAPRTEFVT